MQAPDEAAGISLVYAVGRVNHGIRREMKRRLGEWELSVPEFTAMSVLIRRPRLSNAQVARRTMITPQAMIEVLAKLERRGFVRREVASEHGRILRAELTPEGKALLAGVEPEIRALQDELMVDLTQDERVVLLRAMAKSMARLRSGF